MRKPNAEGIRRAAAFVQRGADLYYRGRYDDALRAFDEALGFNPRSVRAWCGKALCRAASGDAEEGLVLAEKAVALDPEAGIAFTTRAKCRFRLRDTPGAEADYTRALDLAPDDSRVYYNFACHWAERGDERRCREYLTHALDLAPASFVDAAARDPDLARYREAAWFRDLLTEVKARVPGE